MRKIIYIILAVSILLSENILAQVNDVTNVSIECPFKDTELTKEKICEKIKHFWPDRKNILSITILKKENTEDWLIEYHESLPKYLYTNRYISYVYKNGSTCYSIDNLVFYRDYLGGGQYGDIYAGYTDEKIKIINCN